MVNLLQILYLKVYFNIIVNIVEEYGINFHLKYNQVSYRIFYEDAIIILVC